MAVQVERDVVAELLDAKVRLERERAEVGVLVKQTNTEIDRLNASASEAGRRVREIEAHVEMYSRTDIRDAYSGHRDHELRLAMMKSRLEQLDYKYRQIDEYRALLDIAASAVQSNARVSAGESDSQEFENSSGDENALEVVERERERLARYLHDGPAQLLAGLSLQVEACERLFGRDPEQARRELKSVRDLVASDIARVRRLVFELRPMVLDDLGVIPTLRRYAQILSDAEGIKIEVTGHFDTRPPKPAELALFRIAQEAIDNARRHASPKRVSISIDRRDGGVRMEVADDGAGFDPATVVVGRGLSTMRKRTIELGGRLHVQGAPGQGTRVVVQLPDR